jgi:hypothetical protein
MCVGWPARCGWCECEQSGCMPCGMATAGACPAPATYTGASVSRPDPHTHTVWRVLVQQLQRGVVQRHTRVLQLCAKHPVHLGTCVEHARRTAWSGGPVCTACMHAGCTTATQQCRRAETADVGRTQPETHYTRAPAAPGPCCAHAARAPGRRSGQEACTAGRRMRMPQQRACQDRGGACDECRCHAHAMLRCSCKLTIS